MEQQDPELAELEATLASGGGSSGTATMVFEKRDSATEFVRLLSQVEIDASVDERRESHDENNHLDRALAGNYYVIVPSPGQSFQAEIYFDLYFAHGVVPSGVPDFKPKLQNDAFETLLVRRATLAGRWNTRAPCSRGDITWYADVTGLGESEVMNAVRRARETFMDRQQGEKQWSLIGAAACCALGGVLWLTVGFGVAAGLLLASGVSFGIFAMTRESR